MKNFLIRLFISLCIVLLSGYSQLYAHTYQGSSHHSSTKLLKNLEQASFDTAQKSLALITKSASSDRKKVTFKLKATEVNEEEEDEQVLIFSKKYSDSRNYFSAVFWAQALSYFFRSGKDAIPGSEYFSYIPSTRRHLLFQVFRI